MSSNNDTGFGEEPLASREGMIGELLATASVYPLILVVVRNGHSRQILMDMIRTRFAKCAKVEQGNLMLSGCKIMFVVESEVEKYRGSVPVFYDPHQYRDAQTPEIMRITLINQFYPPDISPTGKLTASLAEHRTKLGDEVTVIAGQGYVAQSSESPSVEEAKGRKCASVQPDRQWPALPEGSSKEIPSPFSGPRVVRIWTPRLEKEKLWRRCIDYAFFYLLAAWATMRLRRQDVVICLTTPPFIVSTGLLHKLLHPRTRVILWNMDCYPEVAERAGLIRRGGLLSRLLRKLNEMFERRLDHVVCLDKAMRSLLMSRTPAANRERTISVINNWEPWRNRVVTGTTNRFNRSKWNAGDAFTVLYSGNMGHGHCFETMIAAAERLHVEGIPLRFVITGGGVLSKALQEQVQRLGLRNIDYLGYLPSVELRRLQETASCSLITLRDDMLGVMSPSKLHSSLAMGLPILYIGPRGSNVDEAIETYQCGMSLRHGDIDGVVGFLETLRTNPQMYAKYCARSRRSFERAYSDKQALPKFDQTIESAVTNQPAGYTRRAA